MTLSALLITAFLTAVIHTAAGPDHYLPFIALGRSRNWSFTKTSLITLVAGLGHVLSSILIGAVGLALSIQLHLLEKFEALRGDFVPWMLIAFGLIYALWGLYKVKHHHHHEEQAPQGKKLIPWLLFIIFVFGPCEPLIPLLMFPAAAYGIGAAFLVSLIFLIGTLGTMMIIVLASLYGLHKIPAGFHRYGHSLAGTVILSCGVLVKLGL
jgi:nickel/cobalt exporter